MRSKEVRALPARLQAARRRFEDWRRTRERRSSIPDPLWNLAVKLTTTYGIHRTAQTLRLNADSLKKRVASADVGQTPADGNRPDRKAAATFVELVPSGSPCSPEYMVELEDPGGAKMRIHVKGFEAPDVAALSRSFWGIQA